MTNWPWRLGVLAVQSALQRKEDNGFAEKIKNVGTWGGGKGRVPQKVMAAPKERVPPMKAGSLGIEEVDRPA
jgi:hypothetical protein